MPNIKKIEKIEARHDSALEAFINGDYHNCHCGCGGCLVCCKGECGRGCICEVCIDEMEYRAFGRKFFVVDGGAIVIRRSELEEFLAAHPNAQEVK